MQRDLTAHEAEITDLFLELIITDEIRGNTDDAARYALTALPWSWVDPDFVRWLSEGTLTKVGSHLLRVRNLDDTVHPLTEEL